MSKVNSRLMTGCIVKHFKRDDYLAEKYGPEMHYAQYTDYTYMYRILYIATHTETRELLVIYQAMYENDGMGVKYGQVFARPYDMFMSEVDHEKYPNAKQKYRFEMVQAF